MTVDDDLSEWASTWGSLSNSHHHRLVVNNGGAIDRRRHIGAMWDDLEFYGVDNERLYVVGLGGFLVSGVMFRTKMHAMYNTVTSMRLYENEFFLPIVIPVNTTGTSFFASFKCEVSAATRMVRVLFGGYEYRASLYDAVFLQETDGKVLSLLGSITNLHTEATTEFLGVLEHIRSYSGSQFMSAFLKATSSGLLDASLLLSGGKYFEGNRGGGSDKSLQRLREKFVMCECTDETEEALIQSIMSGRIDNLQVGEWNDNTDVGSIMDIIIDNDIGVGNWVDELFNDD